MLVVLLIERVIYWPPAYHPLTLFRLIASNLARKVNPDKRRSAAQRKIAGTLAIAVLLVPLAMILAMLLFLVQFPFFFDGILLLIAIQYRNVSRAYQLIGNALKYEKKALARHYLDDLVLRETQNLSLIGIAKASIEMLILRTQSQLFCTLFWFAIGGGLAAFMVRLIFELQQSWNTKLPQNREFGAPAKQIWQLLNWLPGLIFIFAFALAQNITGVYNAYKRRPSSGTTHPLKLLCGGALGIQLSGPVIYQGVKRRFMRVGGDREVRFADLKRAQGAIYRSQAVLLVGYLLITVIIVNIGG